MSIVREKLVKEDIELGHGTALVTDPTDPTGNQLSGNKVGIHTFIESVYNVMDFGATGDGVTDDTTAIQLAITTAGADAVVLFPPGDYLISDPLTITNSNVVLRGLGTRWAIGNGSLIQSNDANSDVLTITGVDNVLVENLGLRHKVAAASSKYVINVQGGSQIVIQDCAIVSAAATTNCYEAIHLAATATDAVSNCLISGCYIGRCSNEGIKLIGYSGTYNVSNVTIENCTIESCTVRGIFVTDYCTSVNIENNRISNCAGSISLGATLVDITDHIRICDNTLDTTTSLTHVGGERVENVLVSNNRILDTAGAQYGISAATSSQYWTIIGNHIINSGGGGIYWDASNAFITGNHVDWGAGAGVNLGSSSAFNYVANNVFMASGTRITDSGSSNTFGFNHNSLATTKRYRTSAPDSAGFENQELGIWVNEAGNALTFKVKYSTGTVKSGTVALA